MDKWMDGEIFQFVLQQTEAHWARLIIYVSTRPVQPGVHVGILRRGKPGVELYLRCWVRSK